jgi:transcriptional regulator with XRE-family HTH domain
MAIGWSQAELARRTGIAQGVVWKAESALPGVSLRSELAMCDSLGLAVDFSFRRPLLAGSRVQQDSAHARCVGYVARRLDGEGLRVARELEIVHGRSHGWIDLLGFDPQISR